MDPFEVGSCRGHRLEGPHELNDVGRRERFAPTWLLISAGFDAHRDDPLTELGLTAGDFALLTARAMEMVPPGHRIAMLEGGYDLDALSSCATSVLGALAGIDLAAAELPSSGGPGAAAVDAVRVLWAAR